MLTFGDFGLHFLERTEGFSRDEQSIRFNSMGRREKKNFSRRKLLRRAVCNTGRDH